MVFLVHIKPLVSFWFMAALSKEILRENQRSDFKLPFSLHDVPVLMTQQRWDLEKQVQFYPSRVCLCIPNDNHVSRYWPDFLSALWESESPRLNPGWPLAGLRPLATFHTSLWRFCEKQSHDSLALTPAHHKESASTFFSSSNGYFVMDLPCTGLCSNCFTCINSLNPHSYLTRKGLILLTFTEEGTKAW